MLKKNQPDKVRWEQKHAEALETLKQNFISKPVLTGPKFDREFFVFTDATQKTVAAILAQKDDLGNENVIAYASRKLLDREQKWSYELLCLH